MNCKDFEKLIPDFFERKLDFFTLNQFNKHRKECKSCAEELAIRFLVTEGIQRLEEGDAFDMQRELDQHLEEAERKIRNHSRLIRMGEALEILAILAIAAAVVWVIL
uniref:hypothetical protein n=1 Tax=Acetatifactor sp. TaxID=1872090 RepID=UPI004056C820